MQAGVEERVYHGCPKCDKHVWTNDDVENKCPIVGCNGKRRDDKVCPCLVLVV